MHASEWELLSSGGAGGVSHPIPGGFDHGRYLGPEEVPEAGRVESWFPPGYPFPAPFTARLHSFHEENSSSPASCFPGSGGAACREWWTQL